MATVKENLIAAKALIDTPGKWEAMGRSALDALSAVARLGTPDNQSCIKALQKAQGKMGTDWSNHREVMERFDRAIAEQDGAA
ncbi:hypothetical protein [Devosia sp.]|uniref:hypothetical protein n=1 Tax=Devosia sp. TaxID=1871048 RepID=UPI001AC1D619|nr:hypothetical protein [Devosia sp.]MBN9332979.1 hypothetical protein [Devosia sp.]